MKHVTAIFLKGLFTILPIAVTIILLAWLAFGAEEIFGTAIRWFIPDEWYVPGMGVGVAIALIFGVGLLVSLWGVPELIAVSERLIIARIPLVKTIYGAVRDLLGFFSTTGERGDDRKVVMITLDGLGTRAVGILTRERFEDLPLGMGGEGIVAVYVPYSYQIGGLTLFVPRERVQVLDMDLEDAMRFIVTAGAKGL